MEEHLSILWDMKEAHHIRLHRKLPFPEMKETFQVPDMEEYSTNHPRNNRIHLPTVIRKKDMKETYCIVSY